MKLLCLLAPNVAGHVHASFGSTPKDFKEYLFEPDENDDLVAEVEDEKHISGLLASGNFVPYDASSYDDAVGLMTGIDGDDPDENDDDVDGDDGLETNGDGGPIEALTPASGRKPRKAKAE